MQIELTPEQESFVNEAVVNGRAATPTDAVQAALNLWIERERARYELIAAIEEGEESARQEGWIELDSDEEIHAFFEEIKESGRATLAKAG